MICIPHAWRKQSAQLTTDIGNCYAGKGGGKKSEHIAVGAVSTAHSHC